MSQSIRQLERELGEQLFVRSGRRVTLTPAGRILAEHVEDSFASLARGRAQMQALRELREGALTVSAGDTTTRYAPANGATRLSPALSGSRGAYLQLPLAKGRGTSVGGETPTLPW